MARQGVLVMLIVVVVLGAAACTHLRAETAPSGWPEVWEGRRLVRADDAWVYATTRGAAEDGASLVAGAARDYRSVTGKAAPLAVLIVTDDGEATPMTRLAALTLPELPEAPAGLDSEGARDVAAAREQAAKQVELVRTGVDEMSRCCAVALTDEKRGLVPTLPAAVSGAGYPVVLVPTKRAIEGAVSRFMDQAVKASDMGAVARVLAAPMISWARAKVVRSLKAAAEISVLEALAGAGAERLTGEQQAALETHLKRRRAELEESVELPKGLAGP